MLPYAMDLLARARQADLLREADAHRMGRGTALGGRRVTRPQPRLPEPRLRDGR